MSLEHRHLAGLLLLLGMALSAQLACKGDPPPVGTAGATPAAVSEAVFRVEGMTCASCNLTVKVAAERVRGVRSARADAEQGRAWATFDPTLTTPAAIASAISETGYKATPIDEAVAKSSTSTASGAVAPELACRVMRDGVYRLWPELGRAPRARELAKALGMDEKEVVRVLGGIEGRRSPCGSIELASKSDRIVFAWPLSNVPTEYVLKMPESRPFFARCAIDALGVSAMYGKPVQIEATSVASDTPIRIAVNGDKVERAEPAEAVVWVAGEDCGCDEMALFANRAELDEWRRRLDKPEGHALTLAEATKYGVEVFGSRLGR